MTVVDTALDLAFFVLILTFSFNFINEMGILPVEEEMYLDVSAYDITIMNNTVSEYGLNNIPTGLSDSPYLFGGGILSTFNIMYDFIATTPAGLGTWIRIFVGYSNVPPSFSAMINGMCFILYIILFVAIIRGYYF